MGIMDEGRNMIEQAEADIKTDYFKIRPNIPKGSDSLVFTLADLDTGLDPKNNDDPNLVREIERRIIRFNTTVMLKNTPQDRRYKPTIGTDLGKVGHIFNWYIGRENHSPEGIERLTKILFAMIHPYAPRSRLNLIFYKDQQGHSIESQIGDMIRLAVQPELNLKDDFIYRVNDERVAVVDYGKLLEARRR